MVEGETKKGIPAGRVVGIACALVIPAILAFLFWRTTPAVGGWSQVGGAVPVPGPAPAAPSAATAGSQMTVDPALLYRENCASCHGQALEGTAKAAALKRPNWPYGQNRDLLVKVIHQGRGLTMPGFEGRLRNQQIELLADYLQSQNTPAK